MTGAVQSSGGSSARKQKLAVAMSQTGNVFIGAAFLIVLITTMLSFSGMRTAFVVSDSMVPAFSKGDTLLVSTDYDEVLVGDIVLYDAEWSDQLVSHRVVKVYEDSLVLKGDANEHPDPIALKSSVFGVVGVVIPNLGWVVNPYGVWALLGFGVGLEVASSRFEYVGKHRA